MDDSGERLQRVLGGAALAGLRRRLRRAFEQAAAGADPVVLKLARLDEHEREALAALSARPPRRAASMQIDLPGIDERLRAAGLAGSLREALERLDGPIAPLAALRAVAALAWPALAAAAPHPALRDLLGEPDGLGLLKRLSAQDTAAAQRLCQRAAAVLAAVPARGVPRARLAALCLGDAHALDDGQPTATLVLAALRHALRRSEEPRIGDVENTRALWATQGVGVNELARPVLALNLPGDGSAPTGEPAYWSLRRLLRNPPAWRLAGRQVFVCENPNLLAMAADSLAARCAPLVCTDGMPAAAQRAILGQLAAAGARLRYHGDFDWPGVAIANLVLREFGAAPWRMAADDYLQALRRHDQPLLPLRGRPVAASWDAGLEAAMLSAGQALAEEGLADTLLGDLAAPTEPGGSGEPP